jgi:separase
MSHCSHHQGSVSEDYASLLDLLFVLARTTLAPNNPVSTDAAYDTLARAAGLLGFQLADDHQCSQSISPPSSVTEEAFANFIRCLSGAFHSLGGTLYQAGKYGSAIRFLRRGCRAGAVALHLRMSCDAKILENAHEQQKVAAGKETEGWAQLRDQLSRRWELLGVCFSKIGDRQVSQSFTFALHCRFRAFHLPQSAYDAFIECLSSYVFPHTFVDLVRTIGPAGAFEVAVSIKQAAVIIDRVTYMASCELLRPPAQVSLKQLITSLSIDGAENLEEDRRCVVGAILERQVDSLSGSLWKPDVQTSVVGILSDCVLTYDLDNRPIRRAGVMLKDLELAYYTGTANGDAQLAKSAEEIEALLSLEVNWLIPPPYRGLFLNDSVIEFWTRLCAHASGCPI